MIQGEVDEEGVRDGLNIKIDHDGVYLGVFKNGKPNGCFQEVKVVIQQNFRMCSPDDEKNLQEKH